MTLIKIASYPDLGDTAAIPNFYNLYVFIKVSIESTDPLTDINIEIIVQTLIKIILIVLSPTLLHDPHL
jgi:hypothetical protein